MAIALISLPGANLENLVQKIASKFEISVFSYDSPRIDEQFENQEKISQECFYALRNAQKSDLLILPSLLAEHNDFPAVAQEFSNNKHALIFVSISWEESFKAQNLARPLPGTVFPLRAVYRHMSDLRTKKLSDSCTICISRSNFNNVLSALVEEFC